MTTDTVHPAITTALDTMRQRRREKYIEVITIDLMSQDELAQLVEDLGGRDPADVDAEAIAEALAHGDYGRETDDSARANGNAHDRDAMADILSAAYVRRYEIAGDYLVVWTRPDGISLFRLSVTEEVR